MRRADLSFELERIRIESGGRLTPEAVVGAASDQDSPLHDLFTWDDSKAAHGYRLWEARQIIKSVTIVHGDRTPAYVNIKIGKDQYYQRTEVAVENVDEWKSAVDMLSAKLQGVADTLARLELVAATPDRKKKARVARKGVERATRAVNA